MIGCTSKSLSDTAVKRNGSVLVRSLARLYNGKSSDRAGQGRGNWSRGCVMQNWRARSSDATRQGVAQLLAAKCDPLSGAAENR
jgi:hypothetical protein